MATERQVGIKCKACRLEIGKQQTDVRYQKPGDRPPPPTYRPTALPPHRLTACSADQPSSSPRTR